MILQQGAKTLAEEVAGKAADKAIDASIERGGSFAWGLIREKQPMIWMHYTGFRSRLTRWKPLAMPGVQDADQFYANGSAQNIRHLCKILHRSIQPGFDAKEFFLVYDLAICESITEFIRASNDEPRLLLDLATALASSVRFAPDNVREPYVQLVAALLEYVRSYEFQRAFAKAHFAKGDSGSATATYEANVARLAHRVDCLGLRKIGKSSDIDVSNLAYARGDLNVVCNQAMVHSVDHIKSGHPDDALRTANTALQSFLSRGRENTHLQYFTFLEGANSSVDVALANVLRSKARALLMLSTPTDRKMQREAERLISLAYHLYVTQKPAWMHGLANTCLLAAGAKTLRGDIERAGRLLRNALQYYFWTGDHVITASVSTTLSNLQAGDCGEDAARCILQLSV